MFIPVPNTIELVIEYTQADNTAANVLHWGSNDLAGDNTLVTTVSERLRATWAANIMPKLSNTLAMQRVTARSLEVADGPQATTTAPLTPGGIVGVVTTPQVAFVVKKVTGLSGASRRGRMYIPGIPANAVDPAPGNVLGAQLAPWNTALAAVRADMASVPGVGLGELVVVSRYQGVGADGKPLPRPSGIFTPINLLVLQSAIGTQRERNNRG